jgi:hypothetical protein
MSFFGRSPSTFSRATKKAENARLAEDKVNVAYKASINNCEKLLISYNKERSKVEELRITLILERTETDTSIAEMIGAISYAKNEVSSDA